MAWIYRTKGGSGERWMRLWSMVWLKPCPFTVLLGVRFLVSSKPLGGGGVISHPFAKGAKGWGTRRLGGPSGAQSNINVTMAADRSVRPTRVEQTAGNSGFLVALLLGITNERE
jgi:hypothetical protein